MNNKVILYKSMGRKLEYEDVDKIVFIGNSVYIEKDVLIVGRAKKSKFRIKLDGVVSKIVTCDGDSGTLGLKRLMFKSNRIYDMVITGTVPHMSVEGSNLSIGVCSDRKIELPKEDIMAKDRDSMLFVSNIVDAINSYEALVRKVGKSTELKDIALDVGSVLESVTLANNSFCAYRFSSNLNSLIGHLDNICSKCHTNPRKKVSSVWFSNLMVRVCINRLYRDVRFLNSVGVSNII